MNCKNCNKELEIKEGKEPKVFCSDKCRMAFKRKLLKGNTEQITTPNKSEQATPNTPEKPPWTEGKCRWCGRKIDPAVYGQNWNLVECCYDCVAKRNNINRALYPKTGV